jgi:hypothetical protein
MGDLFFDLWGAMFVAFGLYFVGGRYYVLARQARSALYAVTDRRVLLVGGAFRPKLTEMRLGSLPAVTVEQDLTGVGLITFGPVTRYAAFARAGLPMGSGEVSPVFLAIERPSEVARIIEEAQRSADVGAHPGSRLASAG